MNKCKNYKKDKDKNQCKYFLGYKVSELDNRVTCKDEYKTIESCSCRCSLWRGEK